MRGDMNWVEFLLLIAVWHGALVVAFGLVTGWRGRRSRLRRRLRG